MKKLFTIILLLAALLPAQAFIFFGGSDTVNEAAHAANIDNGTGTNVTLAGKFTAYGSLNILPAHSFQTVTVSSETYPTYAGTYQFAGFSYGGRQYGTNENGRQLLWDETALFGGYWLLCPAVDMTPDFYSDGSGWRLTDPLGDFAALDSDTYTEYRVFRTTNAPGTIADEFGIFPPSTNILTRDGDGSGLTGVLHTVATDGTTIGGDGVGTPLYALGGGGGTMNFDSGAITSDGSGTMTNANVVLTTGGGGWIVGGGDGSGLAITRRDGYNGSGFSLYNLNFDRLFVFAADGGSQTVGCYSLDRFFISNVNTSVTQADFYDTHADFPGTVNAVDFSGGGTNLTGVAKEIPDSGSNGGTCIPIKASDTGGQMYLHVDSAGVITANSTP